MSSLKVDPFIAPETVMREFTARAVITGANLSFAAFPDVTGPAFVAERVMTQEMEETFGAPRQLDGYSQSNSATEAAIDKEESGARILGYIKTLEDTLIGFILSFVRCELLSLEDWIPWECNIFRSISK